MSSISYRMPPGVILTVSFGWLSKRLSKCIIIYNFVNNSNNYENIIKLNENKTQENVTSYYSGLNDVLQLND